MRAPNPATRRRNPEKQQSRALARQREHGNSLRAWMHDRLQAAQKRRQTKAEQAANQRADRPVEYLVQHTDAPYAWRRAQSVRTGRSLQPSRNRPHVNPGRDAKSLAAGRLRRELQP